eukprot:6375400-Prymnesium_polylepis.1
MATAVADELSAATTEPPPKKPKAVARKARHMAAAASGFGQEEIQAAGVDPMSTDHLSISDLTGAACLGNAGSGQAPILSYLRKRYGNHAETVIQIMKAWETYGELFSEWAPVGSGRARLPGGSHLPLQLQAEVVVHPCNDLDRVAADL